MSQNSDVSKARSSCQLQRLRRVRRFRPAGAPLSKVGLENVQCKTKNLEEVSASELTQQHPWRHPDQTAQDVERRWTSHCNLFCQCLSRNLHSLPRRILVPARPITPPCGLHERSWRSSEKCQPQQGIFGSTVSFQQLLLTVIYSQRIYCRWFGRVWSCHRHSRFRDCQDSVDLTVHSFHIRDHSWCLSQNIGYSFKENCNPRTKPLGSTRVFFMASRSYSKTKGRGDYSVV